MHCNVLLTGLLALTVACGGSKPPKAAPPRAPAFVTTAAPLTTATLADVTPPTDNFTVVAAGDTLKLTRYWTPSKGSGVTMIVTGGQNATGGVTAKPDTEAFGAGKGTIILPHARPAPGDSTSLWSCQQAFGQPGQTPGAGVCLSKWFKQPVVIVTPPPVVTPPTDSAAVSVIVPGVLFVTPGTYPLKTDTLGVLVYDAGLLHSTVNGIRVDCRWPNRLDTLTGAFDTGCRRWSDDAHIVLQLCMGVDLGTTAVWASQSKANPRCAAAAPRLAAEFGARWNPAAVDTGWVFLSPNATMGVGHHRQRPFKLATLQ